MLCSRVPQCQSGITAPPQKHQVVKNSTAWEDKVPWTGEQSDGNSGFHVSGARAPRSSSDVSMTIAMKPVFCIPHQAASREDERKVSKRRVPLLVASLFCLPRHLRCAEHLKQKVSACVRVTTRRRNVDMSSLKERGVTSDHFPV